MVSPLNTLVPMSAGLSVPFHFSKASSLERTRSWSQKYLVWMCLTEPAPLLPAMPLAADESVRARRRTPRRISLRR